MGKYTAIKTLYNTVEKHLTEEMTGRGISHHQQVLKDQPAEN